MKKVKLEKEEAKKNRNNIIMGGLIIFLMVGSVMGYLGRDSSSRVESYGKLKFEVKEDGFYYHKTPAGVMRFNLLPQQVEEMPFNSSVLDKIKTSKVIQLTSDLNSTFGQSIAEAQYDFARNVQVLGITSINAFTTNLTKSAITCEDASVFVPVLYWVEGNDTSIELSGECIIITAKDGLSFTMIKDRMLYGLTEILP